MSTLTNEELLADAQEASQASLPKMTLEELTQLGEKLQRLEREALDLEAKLSDKNKEIRELCDRVLPDGLLALRLEGLDLAGGARVELADVVAASINDANRQDAHSWLREHGHGDLIKNEVLVVFGKGEDDDAATLRRTVEAMRKDGQLHCGSVEQKERVHPQTLTAFVKDLLRKGESIPAETFKLYVGHTVKFRRAKEKKS